MAMTTMMSVFVFLFMRMLIVKVAFRFNRFVSPSLLLSSVLYPMVSYNWNDEDVMDYMRQRKYLDSSRFGVFPVESCVTRVTAYGKRQVIACGTWIKSMEQWGKPVVHMSHVKMDTPLSWDLEEPEYFKIWMTFIRDHNLTQIQMSFWLDCHDPVCISSEPMRVMYFPVHVKL